MDPIKQSLFAWGRALSLPALVGRDPILESSAGAAGPRPRETAGKKPPP